MNLYFYDCKTMKPFLLFIIMAAVLSSHSWGQSSVHFRDIGLEEALDLSRIEKKPVFFMGFAEWCGHCNEMKQHVLTDSAVANFYTSHFIFKRLTNNISNHPF